MVLEFARRKLAVALALFAICAANILGVTLFCAAQDSPAAPATAPEVSAAGSATKTVSVPELADFRNHLMLAFGAVFFLITIYLVLSHRKHARLEQELEFMARRITAFPNNQSVGPRPSESAPGKEGR